VKIISPTAAIDPVVAVDLSTAPRAPMSTTVIRSEAGKMTLRG
jgi:hypothetical protein